MCWKSERNTQCLVAKVTIRNAAANTEFDFKGEAATGQGWHKGGWISIS